MEQHQLEYLLSDNGREWFARLEDHVGEPHSRLLWLRKSLSAEQSAALFELERARASLAGRHNLASSFFLDTSAAAQASSQLVANWRARRFRNANRVVDLCCGAGVDTLALAAVAPVLAVDENLLRLSFAQVNAVGEHHDVAFVRGRIPDCLGQVDYAFCDPDRRRDGKRIFDPHEASPSLDELLTLQVSEGMGVKLSPMAPLEGLDDYGELEFVSAARELKEIVLWTGSLSKGGRRVSQPATGSEIEGEVGVKPELAESLGEFLFDPDPGLTRSGLLGDLARKLGLRALAPDIAYLTGDEDPKTPFLTARRIIATSKTSHKALQGLIRTHEIGRLDVSRRGYPQSPEEVRKRLRLKGSGVGHLHLTRFGTQRMGILTKPAQSAR
ncbi:MAG: hypothetical protein ACI97A_000254 [Planctomycetota bacterium]|jgi:hypothetical protein